jgi:hypothetical protein
MSRAELDKRPCEVSAMFDAVADRYDLLNDVLSLGQDRRWRSMVARLVAAKPGDLVLDIAAGTGTSSRAFTSAGARCVARGRGALTVRPHTISARQVAPAGSGHYHSMPTRKTEEGRVPRWVA